MTDLRLTRSSQHPGLANIRMVTSLQLQLYASFVSASHSFHLTLHVYNVRSRDISDYNVDNLAAAVWGALRFGVDIAQFPTIQRVYNEMSKEEAVSNAMWKNQPVSLKSTKGCELGNCLGDMLTLHPVQ